MSRTQYEGRAKRAHEKRTLVSAVMIFIMIPLTLVVSLRLSGGRNYMLPSLLTIIYIMIPFFMIFEKRKPKAREIVLIAMMSAITVVTHMFFHMTVPIQIGTAMVIISGVAMGPEAGFLIGALSRFICNFYMGQGPWTPWQMFSWGLLGFLAGLAFNRVIVENRFEQVRTAANGDLVEEKKSDKFMIIMGPVMCIIFAVLISYVVYLIYPGEDNSFFGWRIYIFGFIGLLAGVLLQRKRLPVDSVTLSVFTFFTTVIIYGGIMNVCAMFSAAGVPGNDISINTLRLLYVSGLPYDVTHGALAAICMFVVGKPMIGKIERIKIKYGIYR